MCNTSSPAMYHPQKLELLFRGMLYTNCERKNPSNQLWNKLRHGNRLSKLRKIYGFLIRYATGNIVFKCHNKKYRITHCIDMATVSSISTISETGFEVLTCRRAERFEAKSVADRNMWLEAFQRTQTNKCIQFVPFYRLDSIDEPLIKLSDSVADSNSDGRDNRGKTSIPRLFPRKRYDTDQSIASKSRDSGCFSDFTGFSPEASCSSIPLSPTPVHQTTRRGTPDVENKADPLVWFNYQLLQQEQNNKHLKNTNNQLNQSPNRLNYVSLSRSTSVTIPEELNNSNYAIYNSRGGVGACNQTRAQRHSVTGSGEKTRQPVIVYDYPDVEKMRAIAKTQEDWQEFLHFNRFEFPHRSASEVNPSCRIKVK